MNGKRLNRILSLVLALILTLLLMLPDGVFVYQAESVASQEDAEQLIPTAAPASDTPAVADPEPVSAGTTDFTVGEAPDAEIPSNDEPAIEASHDDDASTAVSGFVLGMDAEDADPLHAEWRSLPRYGVLGQAFPFEIEVTGGVAPYTYVLIDGDSRRTITEFSATPNHAGVYELRLIVTDAEGEIAELNTSILVSDNVSETREQWEKSLGGFVPTGDWAADLVAVAETQLGYRRSDVNFIINETGEVCGYTRYGDWAEDPYGEWNVAFAAFCLEYAGIDKADFPRAGDCAEWKAALGDLYVEDEEYAPKPGDLVFLHKNGEAETEDWSAPDHVGIVTRVEDGAVYAIEGDAAGEVRENRYDLSDPAIVGFADMEAAQPDADGDDPEGEPEDPNAEQAEGEPADQADGEAEEKTEGEGEPAALRRIGTATGKRVNVRQEATTDSDVVAKLNKGDEVEVLDEIEADGAVWYRVRLEDGEGYVHGKYLDVREEPVEEPAEPAEGEIQEDQSGEELPEDETELPPEDDPDLIPADERELPIYVYTLYENVNILEAAQEDSPVVALLESAGERLDVMDAVELEDVTWYRVRFGEIEGYVSGDMVDFEPDTVLPAFDESATIGNVTVSVSADAGVFPAGAMLSVARASRRSMSEIEGVLDQERAAEVNIAASYTFDIKVLDADGSELEFANDQRVRVSFSTAEVAHGNLETQVYHVAEDDTGALTAEALEVETEGETAVVLTDGFSYYTVEFTYGKMQYVMQGDSTVPLSEIMDYVGLAGEPTAVEVSNPDLFSASNETGEWLVTAHQAFTTDEWMKITVSGVDFEIDTVYEFLVTDAQVLPSAYNNGGSVWGRLAQVGDEQTFLHQSEPVNICIDKKAMSVVPEFKAIKDHFYASGTTSRDDYIYYSGVELNMGADNYFEGDCFKLTFKDAAILEDGSRADVIMTYSNIHFFTPVLSRYSGRNKVYRENVRTYVSCLGTRARSGNNLTTAPHVALQTDITFTIEKDGELQEGAFIYTITDIDVNRMGSSNYASLYGAENHYNYSEQVEIKSGGESVAYIPHNYKSGIIVGGGEGGNGILFITSGYNDSDPGTFYTGFGVKANAEGFTLTLRSAAGVNQQVNTDLMPESVGSLYAEKEVETENATPEDKTRRWEVSTTISGMTAKTSVIGGEGPVHVGNFIKGKTFIFEESDPDLANYETTYEIWNGPSLTADAYSKIGDGNGRTADGEMVCVNTVKFINKRLWQDLTIKKRVENFKPGDEEDRKWSFTLTVLDSDKNNNVPLTGLAFPDEMDWAEVGGGVYTFMLANGESTTISLPKGCKYTLVEEVDPDYSQIGNVADKELTEDTTEEITNDYKTHVLTIQKSASSSNNGQDRIFTFWVKVYKDVMLPDGSMETLYFDLTSAGATEVPGETGIYQVSLDLTGRTQRSKSLRNIPAGYIYEVIERNKPYWYPSSGGRVLGMLNANATASFTNVPRTKVITVTKNWQDDEDNAFGLRAAPKVRIRTRQLYSRAPQQDEQFFFMYINKNTGNGGVCRLPFGWKYLKYGDEYAEGLESYEKNYNQGIGTQPVAMPQLIKRAFGGTLRVGDEKDDFYLVDAYGKELRIRIRLEYVSNSDYVTAVLYAYPEGGGYNGWPPDQAFSDYYTDDAKWDKNSDGTWSYTFSIPSYDVVEIVETKSPSGYVPVGATEHIAQNGENFTGGEFTNRLVKVPLTVSKTVTKGPTNRKWKYTLFLLNPEGMRYPSLTEEALGFTHTGDGTLDIRNGAKGVYTFTLSDGEQASFTLPKGTIYTLSEERDDGYIQSYEINADGATVEDVSTGERHLDEATTVAYTNEKTTVDLTVGKNVAGNMGNKAKYFEIKVTLSNLEANKSYSIDLSNADANVGGHINPAAINLVGTQTRALLTFKLSHGQSVTIRNMPVGASYTVEEAQEQYESGMEIRGDTKTDDKGESGGTDISGTNSATDSCLTADTTITFTNTLETSLPTGIRGNGRVIRVSLIMVVALMLVMNVTRRKRYE